MGKMEERWAESGSILEQAIKVVRSSHAILDVSYCSWLEGELAALEDIIAAAQTIVQDHNAESKTAGVRPFSAFVQVGNLAFQAEGPTIRETRALLNQLMEDTDFAGPDETT